MDLLNLDDLASATRHVTYKGTKYALKEMSVEDFIEATKEAAEIEKAKGDTVKSLEATIRMIKRTIPDMPEELVRAMPLNKLSLIVQFINGELEAEARKADAGETQEGK